MKHVKSNLITLAKAGEFDLIVHGCNCQNTMSSGVAKQIKENFPGAYAVDQATTPGDRSKLGSFTYYRHSEWSMKTAKFSDESDFLVPELKIFYVINAYTQYWFGTSTKRFDYTAFKTLLLSLEAFITMLKKTQPYCKSERPLHLGFPKIGTKRAGGDWDKILPIIEAFEERNKDILEVTIVHYE